MPILIADDHEMARRGFRAIVESEPDLYVVAEAKGGHEAVDKAKTFAPDIILLDINMTHMDGWEATRRLRKEVPPWQLHFHSAKCGPGAARSLILIRGCILGDRIRTSRQISPFDTSDCRTRCLRPRCTNKAGAHILSKP